MSRSGSELPVIDDCWNRIGVWAADSSCERLQQVMHCHNCEAFSAAGRRILDRPAPPGYRREWAEVFAREKEKTQAATTSILIFRLGDENLALPSKLISEITDMKPMRRLPHTQSNIVRGLVNIRGELYVSISMGNLLGLEKGTNSEADNAKHFDRMILVSREDSQFVFPVSEVLGTHRYHSGELQNVPVTISRAHATYTRNVLQWNGRSIACLDDELLFYALNKSLA